MFEDLKDNYLLLIVLGILVLHVGYSIYTYCTKPKIQENFYYKCHKGSAGASCIKDDDCCSSICGIPYVCNGDTCGNSPTGNCKP